MTTSSPGCRLARRLRHALGLALARRQSRQRIGAGGALATPCARLRRRDGNPRLRVLRNDGGARRRRQRLRLHGARRRHALPRRRTVRRRQQAAARQFRHLFVVVGRLLLLLLPRGMVPGGRGGGSEKILPICARAGGASEIVEAATRAAKPVRAMVRNISAASKGRIGLATLYRLYPPLARPPVNTPNTAGKGRLLPRSASTGQPLPHMK